MKELAEEDTLFQSRRRRKADREAAQAKEEEDGAAMETEIETEKNMVGQDGTVKVETYKGAKFY